MVCEEGQYGGYVGVETFGSVLKFLLKEERLAEPLEEKTRDLEVKKTKIIKPKPFKSKTNILGEKPETLQNRKKII